MSDIESLAKEYMGQTPDPQHYRPADQPEKPKASWRGKFFALLLGIIFAFILAEIGLRLLGYNAAENKKTTDVSTGLRIFQANASIPFREECLTNTIKTNSLGFHAREHETEKRSSDYRILIVGDSFVEASQVEVDKTFPAILEDKLKPFSSRRYEVVALGISGNASYANLQYLNAYGLRFKPDLIIDAFYPNDVLADAYRPDNPSAAAPVDEDGNLIAPMPAAAQSLKAQGISWFKKIAKKSDVILLVYSQYLNWRASSNGYVQPGEQPSKTLSIDDELYLKKPTDLYKRAWTIQESIFKEFKKVSQANGAKFAILSLADAVRTHDDLKKEYMTRIPEPELIDLDAPDKQLTSIAARNNIPLLVAEKEFTLRAVQKPDVKTVWSCDGHYNETGHQWTADILYDWLLRNKLLQ